MLRQRKLRDRLVAMAAPPIVVAGAVAAATAVVVDGESGRRVAVAGLAATVIVAVWSVLVGAAVLRSLSALAIEASGMADAQRRVADGDLAIDELPPLGYVGPNDELGRVADAIDAMGRTSVEVAESQRRSIREGLSTIVINLARRNQSLLDRQVEYLDALEQSEEDPDRLGELFRVDHLATRMRRNAESLLVLAGAEPGKRRGNPVTVSDVLRVAIGEVENYQHIELGAIDDGEVPAGVAVDLAHLTAELMENATQFSPPSAPVEVSALRHAPSGTYRVSITDQGMGLGERLDHANETIANPPELGLGMGRSLGFMVVGRLAQRLRATVRLDSNEGGGTIAEVELPLAVLQGQEPPVTAAPAPSPSDAGHAAVATPATTGNDRDPSAGAAPGVPTPQAEAPVASTTLEKLLGINPGGPGPVADPLGQTGGGPAPFTANTTGPATGSPPAAAPSAEPIAPQSLDWQHQSPFAPDSTSVDRHPSSAPIPPDSQTPTWGDLADERPTADADGWTPPPVTPATPPPVPPAPVDPVAEPGSTTPAEPSPLPPPDALAGSSDYRSEPAPEWPGVDPGPPSRFDEAVPSGDAFESGVNSLLQPSVGEVGHSGQSPTSPHSGLPPVGGPMPAGDQPPPTGQAPFPSGQAPPPGPMPHPAGQTPPPGGQTPPSSGQISPPGGQVPPPGGQTPP
ncbi:MAG: ATP-binding protein, partial [Actinomycetota bacterium]